MRATRHFFRTMLDKSSPIRYFAYGVLSTIAIVAVAAWQSKTQSPQVIRAQSFELLDADGRLRAELTTRNEGRAVALRMFSTKGSQLLSLLATDQIGSFLTLGSHEHHWEMSISNFGFDLTEPNGPRVSLSNGPGLPMIIIRDPKGKIVWKAPPKW